MISLRGEVDLSGEFGCLEEWIGGMRLAVVAACFHVIDFHGRMLGARTPDEAKAGGKEDDGHDGAAVMTNEARLPAPFEKAVEFIVSFSEHALSMRGCDGASMRNESQYCCWGEISRIHALSCVPFPDLSVAGPWFLLRLAAELRSAT